ncbi:MAG: hypothetical protein AAB966_00935 [Patescibacteria group bacterium]
MPTVVPTASESPYQPDSSRKFLNVLIVFVIVFAVTWLILFSIKPEWSFIPEQLKNLDKYKISIAAVVMGVIAVVIAWIIMACRKRN